MEKPLITIVTAVYNGAIALEETILSVINQTYLNIEYIVIDGKSTDKTIDIIKKYNEKIDYWISEPDNGIYNAMNKGLAKASGDWVFFLNVGDNFESNSVIENIPFQKAQEDVAFIVGHVFVRMFNGVYPASFETVPFYLNPQKYKNMGFSHQGVFVRTQLVKHIGFDEHFKLCADYDMLVKLVERKYKGMQVNLPIAIIEGRDGASQRKAILQFNETVEICKLNNDSLYYYYRLIRAYLGLYKMNFFRFFNHIRG